MLPRGLGPSVMASRPLRRHRPSKGSHAHVPVSHSRRGRIDRPATLGVQRRNGRPKYNGGPGLDDTAAEYSRGCLIQSDPRDLAR